MKALQPDYDICSLPVPHDCVLFQTTYAPAALLSYQPEQGYY